MEKKGQTVKEKARRAERERAKHAAESSEQRAIKLQGRRDYQRKVGASETKEGRETRLQSMRDHQREARENESQERANEDTLRPEQCPFQGGVFYTEVDVYVVGI